MSNGRRHKRTIRRGRLEQVYADALAQAPEFVRLLPGGDEFWTRGEVGFVLPGVPAGAGPALRDALERRRRAALEGRCACGGRLHLRRLHPGGLSSQTFVHENDCPAADVNLRPLLKASR